MPAESETALHQLTDVDQTFAEEVQFAALDATARAYHDIIDGFKKWHVWLMLAYQDIKLRYRRSLLGPFWITISMAVTVYSMGFLYAKLFRTDIQQYYPFLVAGMLAWNLISSTIIELVESYISYEGLIKQIKLPYTLYIHRIIARNLLIFFHNILVMLPIYLLFSESVKINLNTLYLFPGLMIIYINGFIWGNILAMIGARYRDVNQLIKSIVQIIFFITPVMWSPLILSPHSRYFIYANPFYSYLELMRAPLIGQAPTLFNISVSLGCAIVGWFVALKLFVPYRSRIIYWL